MAVFAQSTSISSSRSSSRAGVSPRRSTASSQRTDRTSKIAYRSRSPSKARPRRPPSPTEAQVNYANEVPPKTGVLRTDRMSSEVRPATANVGVLASTYKPIIPRWEPNAVFDTEDAAVLYQASGLVCHEKSSCSEDDWWQVPLPAIPVPTQCRPKLHPLFRTRDSDTQTPPSGPSMLCLQDLYREHGITSNQSDYHANRVNVPPYSSPLSLSHFIRETSTSTDEVHAPLPPTPDTGVTPALHIDASAGTSPQRRLNSLGYKQAAEMKRIWPSGPPGLRRSVGESELRSAETKSSSGENSDGIVPSRGSGDIVRSRRRRRRSQYSSNEEIASWVRGAKALLAAGSPRNVRPLTTNSFNTLSTESPAWLSYYTTSQFCDVATTDFNPPTSDDLSQARALLPLTSNDQQRHVSFKSAFRNALNGANKEALILERIVMNTSAVELISHSQSNQASGISSPRSAQIEETLRDPNPSCLAMASLQLQTQSSGSSLGAPVEWAPGWETAGGDSALRAELMLSRSCNEEGVGEKDTHSALCTGPRTGDSHLESGDARRDVQVQQRIRLSRSFIRAVILAYSQVYQVMGIACIETSTKKNVLCWTEQALPGRWAPLLPTDTRQKMRYSRTEERTVGHQMGLHGKNDMYHLPSEEVPVTTHSGEGVGSRDNGDAATSHSTADGFADPEVVGSIRRQIARIRSDIRTRRKGSPRTSTTSLCANETDFANMNPERALSLEAYKFGGASKSTSALLEENCQLKTNSLHKLIQPPCDSIDRYSGSAVEIKMPVRSPGPFISPCNSAGNVLDRRKGGAPTRLSLGTHQQRSLDQSDGESEFDENPSIILRRSLAMNIDISSPRSTTTNSSTGSSFQCPHCDCWKHSPKETVQRCPGDLQGATNTLRRCFSEPDVQIWGGNTEQAADASKAREDLNQGSLFTSTPSRTLFDNIDDNRMILGYRTHSEGWTSFSSTHSFSLPSYSSDSCPYDSSVISGTSSDSEALPEPAASAVQLLSAFHSTSK